MSDVAERQVFRTSVCKISGDLRSRGRTDTAILCVRGIWAPRDFMNGLFAQFPDRDIFIGDVPGMWTPVPTPGVGLRGFARAYDDLVAQLFPHRPIVAVGISTGAVIALAMRAPQVATRVLLEPFLSTAPVWPLVKMMRRRIHDHPRTASYVRDVLGVHAEGVDDLDFSDLLESLDGPLFTAVGETPLGEARPLPHAPSFTGPDARARLAARGELHVGPPGSGHSLTGSPAGAELVSRLVAKALEAAGG